MSVCVLCMYGFVSMRGMRLILYMYACMLCMYVMYACMLCMYVMYVYMCIMYAMLVILDACMYV